MHWRTLCVTLALGAATAVTCSRQPETTSTSSDVDSSRSATASPTWQAELVPVTIEGWQQELASMRGRIVVVELWATWCLPCVERFPHIVALARRYRDRGVAFVSLSLDDRDDEAALAQAQSFLTEQEARFPNFLMDEVVTHAFEELDLLGIPAVFIYDSAGVLRHRLTGDDPNNQFSEADVELAIDELLAET